MEAKLIKRALLIKMEDGLMKERFFKKLDWPGGNCLGGDCPLLQCPVTSALVIDLCSFYPLFSQHNY